MMYNKFMNIEEKTRKEHILKELSTIYDDVRPALHYRNPYELLIAVLLSAQCTDVRVNQVTKELFALAPDCYQMVELGEKKVREIIQSCGLYKNKARNIVALSEKLIADYDGQVPKEREALESLPGIGRKSASVVMSVAFGLPALAVDTHIFRVSRRLGLSTANDVRGVEDDLTALIPEEDWGKAHHWLIFHGRRVCKAQRPLCDDCSLQPYCPQINP